jgi:protein-tyrosine-phosphatase
MAEAYFKDLCRKSNRTDIQVSSAGIFAGDSLPVSAEAVRVMSGYGIDMIKHKSRQITEELVMKADLIAVMTKSHKRTIQSSFNSVSDKVFMLHDFDRLQKDVFDPFGENFEVYKKCFTEMKKALDNLFLDIDKL